MKFSDWLFGNDKKDNKASEKEMDFYGLNEQEKEEVRKGHYDPWDFEEDELEESDYYYDDE